jgi:hypothetical protein
MDRYWFIIGVVFGGFMDDLIIATYGRVFTGRNVFSG